jgi:membrane protease YdiL (CAAX protease family)
VELSAVGTRRRERGVTARSTSWVRVPGGLLVVFALFHGLASRLGSDRGQSGLIVGAMVVLGTLLLQRVLFGQSPAVAIHWLGLTRTTTSGLGAAGTVGALLALIIPFYAWIVGASVAGYPGWLALLPGLFAQAGVAEEVLFRGYLFGHAREHRPFWPAVLFAMGPFVAVHLLLFLTLPWALALASVALAAATTPPLAYLYELGGRSIWPPALVHFVMQGAIKVVVVSGETGMRLPLIWMIGCATLPYLVFLVRAQGDPAHRSMRVEF